jgi:tripartite-type tricarboxylate transporter receptor subunit TctC
MQRSFNAPPGMSKEAQQFYIDLFGKVFASKQWQDYCNDEGLMCEKYVAGDELAAFHEKQLVRHRELIAKVGAKAITGE